MRLNLLKGLVLSAILLISWPLSANANMTTLTDNQLEDVIARVGYAIKFEKFRMDITISGLESNNNFLNIFSPHSEVFKTVESSRYQGVWGLQNLMVKDGPNRFDIFVKDMFVKIDSINISLSSIETAHRETNLFNLGISDFCATISGKWDICFR